MRVISAVVGVATLLVSVPGDASEQLVLEPSSHWQLNYDRGSCRLSRTFGEGEKQVLAHFVRYTPSPDFEVLLVGEPIDGRNAPLEYSFLPWTEKQSTRLAMFGETEEGRPSLFLAYQFQTELENGAELPRPQREAVLAKEVRQISGLRISRGVETSVDLRLSGFAQAMGAMDRCLDDLVLSWGGDPEKRAKITKGPIAINADTWAKKINYPKKLLFRDSRGKVTVRLLVDGKGNAVECQILDEAYDPEFGKATCEGISETARFEPALDADSKPVADFFVATVRFAIPEIEDRRRSR